MLTPVVIDRLLTARRLQDLLRKAAPGIRDAQIQVLAILITLQHHIQGDLYIAVQ